MTMNNYCTRLIDYWENAHIECDLAKLTGSDLRSHLVNLCVELAGRNTILCIGIGTGEWVNELALAVSEVWSLDISKAANAKVSPLVRCVNDASDLPSQHFDLALSQWVTPHMHNTELSYQLNHVIRSLTAEGVLAMHYNEPYLCDPTSDDLTETERYAMAVGGVVRITRSDLHKMVRSCGGDSVIITSHDSSAHKLTAVVTHIRKRSQESII